MPPDALDEQALPRLLRAAREAGHELRVDEDVWTHLAAPRDAAARLQRLEQLCADGPQSAALQQLQAPDAPPLLPLQLEAAVFAICAGRCILADAPALQPLQQARAAALLWQRHFGVERVLVLAPQAALAHWRRALPPTATGWSLLALERVAEDAALHRELAPELVIVHEADEGGLWIDPERAAALLRLPGAHAMVLPAPGWQERVAELPLRIAFVDAQRLGPYDALLQQHGQRDDAGALCGLQDLDGLRATLAKVLLARPLDELRGQLPERLALLRRVPLPAAAQAQHAQRLQSLAESVARWQRSDWISATQQRQLLAQVQALRRLCAGVAAGAAMSGDDGQDEAAATAVVQAKAVALQAWLHDGGPAGAPVAKAVVFSQWPQALQALQGELAAAGVEGVHWRSSDTAAQRQAALQRWQHESDCRLLLVADAGSAALELRLPQAQVVHLERPWNARVLARRFGRVHRRGQAQLVTALQLLLADSFEDAIERVLGERREPAPTELLDAGAEAGFEHGAALTQWRADLRAVLDACGT